MDVSFCSLGLPGRCEIRRCEDTIPVECADACSIRVAIDVEIRNAVTFTGADGISDSDANAHV